MTANGIQIYDNSKKRQAIRLQNEYLINNEISREADCLTIFGVIINNNLLNFIHHMKKLGIRYESLFLYFSDIEHLCLSSTWWKCTLHTFIHLFHIVFMQLYLVWHLIPWIFIDLRRNNLFKYIGNTTNQAVSLIPDNNCACETVFAKHAKK